MVPFILFSSVSFSDEVTYSDRDWHTFFGLLLESRLHELDSANQNYDKAIYDNGNSGWEYKKTTFFDFDTEVKSKTVEEEMRRSTGGIYGKGRDGKYYFVGTATIVGSNRVFAITKHEIVDKKTGEYRFDIDKDFGTADFSELYFSPKPDYKSSDVKKKGVFGRRPSNSVKLMTNSRAILNFFSNDFNINNADDVDNDFALLFSYEDISKKYPKLNMKPAKVIALDENAKYNLIENEYKQFNIGVNLDTSYAPHGNCGIKENKHYLHKTNMLSQQTSCPNTKGHSGGGNFYLKNNELILYGLNQFQEGYDKSGSSYKPKSHYNVVRLFSERDLKLIEEAGPYAYKYAEKIKELQSRKKQK